MSVPYELVWLSCKARPAVAERFFVPTFRGELPFLVAADRADDAETDPLGLNEEQLLHGLLCTFAERDNDGYLVARPEGTDTFLELFEIMRQGFGFEDYERLVLETSGILRTRFGVQPSQACLSAGRLLAPDSAQIRADLMLDLWVASREAADNALAIQYRRLLPELFTGLKASAIPAKTYALCVYLNLAARYLRDDFAEAGSLESFLVEDVIEHIRDEELKAKLKLVFDAVRDDRKLSFADFDVE